jgi:hypothetical protein
LCISHPVNGLTIVRQVLQQARPVFLQAVKIHIDVKKGLASTHIVVAAAALVCLQDKWDGLRDLVQNMASTTKVSNQPAIYGQLAAADVMRLKGQVQPGLTTGG